MEVTGPLLLSVQLFLRCLVPLTLIDKNRLRFR